MAKYDINSSNKISNQLLTVKFIYLDMFVYIHLITLLIELDSFENRPTQLYSLIKIVT